MKNIFKVLNLFIIALCLLFCSSCGEDKSKVIVVGASPSPHAEILKQAQAYIESKGYTLEIREFVDYIIPNTLTEEGVLDANFFQHEPYLIDFNKSNNTHLVSVLKVHYEYLGLYKGKSTSLENIKDGATICVPNDTTNFSRACLLLQELGLITVDESKGLALTLNDITSNPHNLKIQAAEAASLPRLLGEYDYGVINGNYALSNGLKSADLMACESSESEAPTTYLNILVVKAGNEESEKTKLLIEALQQPNIEQYIKTHYEGVVEYYKDK